MEARNMNIRSYVVWGPFLHTDTEATARDSTARTWAPNTVYFWVPDQTLALEAGSVLQLAAGRPAWDVYLLYRRGVFWEKTFPNPDYWQQQLDVLQGDKYSPETMRIRIEEFLRE
jgi:hypothetical protein